MRLLLAEDEKLLSDALVVILSHSGYTVDAVYDGADALSYLESGDYDGAILDIMMPKMDGLTVLKKIRTQGKRLPVLILTARSEIDDRVMGLDSGADDYLTKPFDTKELLARIRAMTRRQPELQDAELCFEDLQLRQGDCILSGPRGKVSLLHKEFQMMEMLMANPRQFIPSERFLEKIWGYDTDAEINVVWVNLSALRKKIEKVGASVQIKANRGVGYRLEKKP